MNVDKNGGGIRYLRWLELILKKYEKYESDIYPILLWKMTLGSEYLWTYRHTKGIRGIKKNWHIYIPRETINHANLGFT